jgi:dTDP-4-dehydrorhamnose 3,5-epimerase
MRTEHAATPIPGVFEVRGTPHVDVRGSFLRLLGTDEHRAWWNDRPVMQVNHSRTVAAGAIRGLHVQQPPAADAKLVRCIRGRVFDVAVDLRPGSPTFLAWHAVELAPAAGAGLLVPEGCAHGFQVIEPDSELVYVHSASYSPEHETGVLFDDPLLDIAWPVPATDVSDRDRRHMSLGDRDRAASRFRAFSDMVAS